jgi:protein required for attachment to host cells
MDNTIHHLGPVWILVAHESGARIFSRLNHQSPLRLVETIANPIGRAKNQEIVSDKPGREEDWGPSANRHGFGSHIMPVEKNALDFARALAERLDKARDLNYFDHLILVAGPKMLGLIRRGLPLSTANRVVATLSQNLGKFENREISEHLTPVLDEFDRTQGLKSVS